MIRRYVLSPPLTFTNTSLISTSIVIDPEYNRPDDPIILNYTMTKENAAHVMETLEVIENNPYSYIVIR
jgi:hypothetical protein